MSSAVRRRCWPVAAAGLFLLSPAAAWAQDRTRPSDDALLDPGDPLAPMPELGLDWPDLKADPADPAAASDAPQIAAETRYRYRVEGMDGIWTDLMRQRFNEASTLRTGEGKPANAAQLDRRAREDAGLLNELLRAEGYYDAEVQTRVEAEAGDVTVLLTALPGEVYRFAGVTLEGLEAAGAKTEALRKAFAVEPKDPVNADTIAAAEANLKERIGREGFPFAEVGESRIVVDHATRTATLAVKVSPGEALRFAGSPRAIPACSTATTCRTSPASSPAKASTRDRWTTFAARSSRPASSVRSASSR